MSLTIARRAVALCLALMPCLGASVSAAARPTAKAIFLQARAAVGALPAAPYVAFTIEEQGETDGVSDRALLRVLFRVADGLAVVLSLRDRAGDDVDRPQPETVAGADYWPLSSIWQLGDFPLADFGVRAGSRARPGMFEAPGTPEPSATPPPVIASVTVVEPPPYAFTDLGDALVDGRAAYHIGLSPLRDPGHHVLRQMWIDKTTSLPLRYVVERYVDAPEGAFSYLVTVDTAVVAGHLVNVSADGTSANGRGKWHVSDFSFPTNEPDWVFDAGEWTDHHGETIPALGLSAPAIVP